MRKITKISRFEELRVHSFFPRWVIGGMKQKVAFTEYKVSDEQRKNIELIDQLSPIIDLDKIEALLIPDLLNSWCSSCGKKHSEVVEIVKDEPYDQTGCDMCLDCLQKAIDLIKG